MEILAHEHLLSPIPVLATGMTEERARDTLQR
ncbi:hypothetical protein FHT80_000363 [Rhizobium sp. BK226]|nr:hypothetical protein [Rhizobium sp. BK226]